ncbi:MAG: heparinase II/III family protein, partial [Planctomycetota bacterium]
MSALTTEAMSIDWLGRSVEHPHPRSFLYLGEGEKGGVTHSLLDGITAERAREATTLHLQSMPDALVFTVDCETVAMDRIRRVSAIPTPHERDTWGEDAVEFQIDPGCTREAYHHIIVFPDGRFVSLHGFNNRQVQGWHPDLGLEVTLEEDRWMIALRIPHAALGVSPAPGDVWGLNVIRVNPEEERGYVQWNPTWGDALKPELFGTLIFAEGEDDREAEVTAFQSTARGAAARFRDEVNSISEPDLLSALGFSSWQAWGDHLAGRTAPLGLRWDAIATGREGIPTLDEANLLTWADALVAAVGEGEPIATLFALERLELLGDAFLLTGNRDYVKAFEKAIAAYGQELDRILPEFSLSGMAVAGVTPYTDYHLVRAGIVAYTYLAMRGEDLSDRTHAVVMHLMLQTARHGAENISSSYCYGNHQLYESAALTVVAALFPEFSQSGDWAEVASQSIRIHLEREVTPDGGYLERCGYHSVALNFTMQAMMTIRVNGGEDRFPILFTESVLSTLETMHDWI